MWMPMRSRPRRRPDRKRVVDLGGAGIVYREPLHARQREIARHLGRRKRRKAGSAREVFEDETAAGIVVGPVQAPARCSRRGADIPVAAHAASSALYPTDCLSGL
jgi:hypothetical protein